MRGRGTTVDRSDPRGSESRKIFSTSRILRLHAPKKTDRDKTESPSYQDTPRATKRRPRPSESSRPKSLQMSILLLRRLGGYCRVSILGIPKARKLASTLTSPNSSRRIKRSRPTPRPRALSRPTSRLQALSHLTPWVRAPSHPTLRTQVPSRPRPRAPSRPTSRPRARLARPRGRGLRLTRPLGCGLLLARPQGHGLCLARPRGRGLRLARPLGCGLRLAQGRGLHLAQP